MNRTEALSYIRENSRPMASYPIKKEGSIEQRLSNAGVPFILHDMGRLGWDVYFLSGSNDIQKTINEFDARCLKKEPV